MQNLSEIIGKPAYTSGGEYAGTVKNARLSKNLKKLRGFECFDEQEEEFELPVTAVASVGDALLIKSLSAKPYKETVPAPFGISVFSETGENLGLVSDFRLEEKEVIAVVLEDGKEIELSRMEAFSDALIVNLTGEPVKKPVCKRPPRARETGAAESARQEKTAEKAETPPAAAGTAKGNALRAGSNLLTGKRATADIFDVRGNLVVAKGAVITPEIIRRALAHNKLFELTVSVLPLA